MEATRSFEMVDNYMYLYHTNTLIVLPTYPEQINDTMQANFATTNVMARSAPIYSYQNSGPRMVQITLNLHRELMSIINWQSSTLNADLNDDYVDTIIKQIQSCVVPKYEASSKMVDPPVVAIRFGDDIYCKGVIIGGVSITHQLPIVNNKYSMISLSFSISEIEAYGADEIAKVGSYRGVDVSLERNVWRVARGGSVTNGR